MKPFTLVSTVFNEMRRLNQTIADIEAQTRKPTELIITDAGSTDGTYERLLQWKAESSIAVVVLQMPKCNIAEGRNLAISKAAYPLIASTDFGCRFKPEWLANLMAPFDADPAVEVTGGAFSVIKEDIVTPAAKADFVLSKGYPVNMDEYFSVSSRSIGYCKYVWEQIGGYQEWLTLAADDTIFWRQIKKRGYKYALVSSPDVFWLRHKTFLAYGKENFRYGLGDGESGINYRNFISHVIETGHRWLTFLLILGLPYLGRYPMLAGIICGQIFLLRSYRYAFKCWLVYRKQPGYGLPNLFACFYMIEVTRVWYMRGYIKGRFYSTQRVKEGAKKIIAELA